MKRTPVSAAHDYVAGRSAYISRATVRALLQVLDSAPAPEVITGPADALPLLRGLRALPHEELWIVLLNGQNQCLGVEVVARGGLAGASCSPADILRPVVASGARAFLLAHNHPSGSSKPSREDLLMTQQVLRGARLLGVPCLDHIVVSGATAWDSILDELKGSDDD
jgi:DNA repair protein RadC